MDVPVGPRVLRDRDGRRARQPALRHDAPRRHPVPGQPPPGGPRRDLGHGHRQDGAGDQAALRADARPEVRDLDGLVRQLRRPLLGLVLGHQGRRPDHPGRHLHPGLPAPARGAAPGRRACSRSGSRTRASATTSSPPVGAGSRSPLADETTPEPTTPAADGARDRRRSRRRRSPSRPSRSPNPSPSRTRWSRSCSRASSAELGDAIARARRLVRHARRAGAARRLAPRRPSSRSATSTATTSRSSSGIDWQPAPKAETEDTGDTSSPAQPTEMTFGDRRRRRSLPGVRARAVDDEALGRHDQDRRRRRSRRTSRAGSRCTRARTGTSASAGRCSGSSSTVTRASGTCTCPAEFEGHPLRKDFPLLAREVKPWPGLVDVEPMPGEDEPAEAAAEVGDES